MSETSTDQLKQAVEFQYGGTATFVQAVPVNESFRDQPVWHGVVHIFDLKDSTSGATRAYAWSHMIDDNSAKRRFYAVLHMGPITGPVEAVRAAMVAEQRTK
jgi:hypothetical protein